VAEFWTRQGKLTAGVITATTTTAVASTERRSE
jgi:hypothetical protein